MSQWVTVINYYDHREAALIKTLLEANGFECRSRDEMMAQNYGGLVATPFGGVKLEVRADQAEEAKNWLRQMNYLVENDSNKIRDSINQKLNHLQKRNTEIPWIKVLLWTTGILIVLMIMKLTS